MLTLPLCDVTYTQNSTLFGYIKHCVKHSTYKNKLFVFGLEYYKWSHSKYFFLTHIFVMWDTLWWSIMLGSRLTGRGCSENTPKDSEDTVKRFQWEEINNFKLKRATESDLCFYRGH